MAAAVARPPAQLNVQASPRELRSPADLVQATRPGGPPARSPPPSSPWTRHVQRRQLQLLKPPAKDGHKWVMGRLTKIQKTTRPDNLWPEIWKRLGKKQKQQEIKNWEEESAARDAARKKRGIDKIETSEIETYLKLIAEAKEKCNLPEAPAMPFIPLAMNANAENMNLTNKQ